MNKPRRKDLDKALELIGEARSLIENARDEEQEYFDNIPENLQMSDRGQEAEQAADNLSQAADAFDDMESYISEAQG